VKVEKILTLSFLLLVLVSIVNHQLTQKNASLIPTVQAQGTPTPTPTSTPTPTPTPTPGVGCTPGFWKNNAAKKNASQWTTYTPGELLSAAGFTTPITFTDGSTLADVTLLQALSFQGGSTLEGASETLLRAAVAAILNAAKFGGSASTIITNVNDALASGDRTTIISLAATLDAANNLGCPLSNN